MARLRITCGDLREENAVLVRKAAADPEDLKWLIYFRAPTSETQVLALVRHGLVLLLARDPSFCGRESVTTWASQPGTDWRAFRVDFVGRNLAGFRATMKEAYVAARLNAKVVTTQQPPNVTMYRQLPKGPRLFRGTLEELEDALRQALAFLA